MTHQWQHTATLTSARRAADIEALADQREPVDLLVIGGGINGVATALDAATRGLSVVMVEARDLAHGTSRWSSKLIHGGLRYLATGNVAIARESAVERDRVMTVIAPHLVRPMTQLVPTFNDTSLFAKSLVRAGFVAGDVLRATAGTAASVLPRSGTVDAETARQMCPTLREDGLRGGTIAHDGQMIDDARVVVAVARTAAQYGASVLTYMRASEVTGSGAVLTDSLTGATYSVKARSVVNATGVWSGSVDSSIRVRPSRGTHLVFDAAALGNPTAALTVAIPGTTNRFVFAMPEQLGRVYLGLTDEDAPGEIPDEPTPAESEIDFLLDTMNTALGTPLTRDDIRGAFAGLRPLIDGGGDSADLSRQHQVSVNDTGVITVVGGKFTTFRAMAQDAVDAAVDYAQLPASRCCTATLPLIGALGKVDQGLPDSLVARFGAEAGYVLDQARCTAPDAPIAEGIDVTRAEIEFARTHEGAMTVDDVLHRRTRIGLVAADADAARPAVTEIVGG